MTRYDISISAAEELAEWFLPKMNPEMRNQLMAERPQLYAEIFPGVNPDIILSRVADAMERRCTTCRRSAHTPESTSYHGHLYTGPPASQALTADDIITRVTEAATRQDALHVLGGVPDMLEALADQLHIDPYEHAASLASLRQAIADEIRA